MDTTDRQWNTGSQLETDVAECRWTWTSWGVVATEHSYASTRHDYDVNFRLSENLFVVEKCLSKNAKIEAKNPQIWKF